MTMDRETWTLANAYRLLETDLHDLKNLAFIAIAMVERALDRQTAEDVAGYHRYTLLPEQVDAVLFSIHNLEKQIQATADTYFETIESAAEQSPGKKAA